MTTHADGGFIHFLVAERTFIPNRRSLRHKLELGRKQAVVLVTPGHFVMGLLVNNEWSVGGNPLLKNVNEFLAQPFINYNMAHGNCTTGPERRIPRWEHEHLLERCISALIQIPEQCASVGRR